jgi:hypothetical protein
VEVSKRQTGEETWRQKLINAMGVEVFNYRVAQLVARSSNLLGPRVLPVTLELDDGCSISDSHC